MSQIQVEKQNPIDYLVSLYEENKRPELAVVLRNLDSEFSYFNWRAAISAINANKKDAVEDSGLLDERDEVIESIAEDADNDLILRVLGISEDELEDDESPADKVNARNVYKVLFADQQFDKVEELNEVNEKIEEVRKPYKELAEEPRANRNDAKSTMASTIEKIMGETPSTPEGTPTEPEE